MCTNGFECYMDDLVDCFEDFVRKSLLVVSVAVGIVIIMVMYVLKVMAERTVVQQSPGYTRDTISQFRCNPSELTSCRQADSDNQIKSITAMGGRAVHSTYVMSTANSALTSERLTSRPSFEEKVLREIGLSTCSKPCNTSDLNLVSNLQGSSIMNENEDQQIKETKTEIFPTDVQSCPTCTSKHHLSESRPCFKYVGIRSSCCSMCCDENDRR